MLEDAKIGANTLDMAYTAATFGEHLQHDLKPSQNLSEADLLFRNHALNE